MHRRIFALMVASLMAGTAWGARTIEFLEGSYEARLSNITFPSSTAGTLIFRPCSTCDGRAHQVDSSTVYSGPDGPLPLDRFLDKVAELRQTAGGNESTAVGVYYSLDTNRITRVILFPGVTGGQ